MSKDFRNHVHTSSSGLKDLNDFLPIDDAPSVKETKDPSYVTLKLERMNKDFIIVSTEDWILANLYY